VNEGEAQSIPAASLLLDAETLAQIGAVSGIRVLVAV
jgi:hypothetical protein